MGFYWVHDVYRAYQLPNKTVDVEGMAVLLAIAHCMNDGGNTAFPSANTIAKMTHLARGTVFKRLNKLGENGVLTYKQGGFYDGRTWANEYTIHFPEGFEPTPRKGNVMSDANTQFTPCTGMVHGVDGGGARDTPRVVHTVYSNNDNKKQNKKNATGMGDTSHDFFVIGKSFDSHKPRLGVVGELMDFCFTNKQSDAATFSKLAIQKGKEAVRDLLDQLKAKRAAGKLKNITNMAAFVTGELTNCPDKDYVAS